MARVELFFDAVAVTDDQVVPCARVTIADGRFHAFGTGSDRPPALHLLNGTTALARAHLLLRQAVTLAPLALPIHRTLATT